MMSRDHQLGDAPIEDQYAAAMNEVARMLDKVFNGDGGERKTGFVLITFAFGFGTGRCNYISNAQRADVVNLLKAQLARFEGQPDVEGHA